MKLHLQTVVFLMLLLGVITTGNAAVYITILPEQDL
jgi:hypothetical protein